jgi:DNA-binding NarL/FixJ family response regulator
MASFERLGATYDSAQAASFLTQLGAAPSRVARAKETLTPREQQVLRFLGSGLTNRQIAERLVVSPKTVEHHVSQILSKLGAKTRAEAAAMAARM